MKQFNKHLLGALHTICFWQEPTRRSWTMFHRNNYTNTWYASLTLPYPANTSQTSNRYRCAPIKCFQQRNKVLTTYLLVGIVGVREEENLWRMMMRRWSAAKFGERDESSSRKWRIWWRWRVEVELWYGRWLEEMKEKVSHVCSQINRSVEWSQTLASISNSRVTITIFEWLYL